MVNTFSIPADTVYDRLAKMAGKLLDVPIVILTFVNEGKICLKSVFGINHNAIQLPKKNSLDSLVIADFDIQFFAVAPLVSIKGVVVGEFCLLDNQVRFLTEIQEEFLQEFADMALAYMENSLAASLAISQQNQLLQIAAHDLKNPLTTIPVRADLIKLKKNDPELIDRMCDQIKQAGLMMTRTIDDLLSTARFEAGKISLYTLKLDFADLVSQIIDANEALANHKGQQIKLCIESRPFVNADEQRLNEIVDNLINNAIKYSPKGEVITVIIGQQNDKVIMQVQDNGPGLTMEDKSRMFQPYSKLSAHPTGGENSTGLGLSIVKQLVEAHHGQVWAESDGAGKGTSFFVEMPSFN
ncbi:signal transduction histidine kinase [Pedobacter sp. CG_S7]|uniref:GAF domain-containing sensor histidine kinase n=1 Tax=Pedobacter sp. CG_S7 TaxID=3143930 RepID=UPI003394D625